MGLSVNFLSYKPFLGCLGQIKLSDTFLFFHFYLARVILIWVSSSAFSSFIHSSDKQLKATMFRDKM